MQLFVKAGTEEQSATAVPSLLRPMQLFVKARTEEQNARAVPSLLRPMQLFVKGMLLLAALPTLAGSAQQLEHLRKNTVCI
jgi:hypothetical protein